MPDAKIEKSTDVLVRTTTINICCSNLYMYQGHTEMESGRILGHENLGEVIEVGDAVDRVQISDIACLPFNIGCGFCENCERGLTGYCFTVKPGSAGGSYGFAGMGPYSGGGQAEYLRVPYGNFNYLVLPEDAIEKENDYVMLSDILPTGYHATELAGVIPGDTVVIYGAGPVGLMAATSAYLKGARQVMVVNTHKDRQKLAEKIGATSIDDSESRGVEQLLALTKGQGADRGCECVGYQCCNMHGKEVPNLTMNNLVKTVKATGGIGVVGVFLPKDPGSHDALAREGKLAFNFGEYRVERQQIASGRANVKAYNREVAKLIEAGRVLPLMIISHELALKEAPQAYKNFEARNEGWTKVVLKPGK